MLNVIMFYYNDLISKLRDMYATPIKLEPVLVEVSEDEEEEDNTKKKLVIVADDNVYYRDPAQSYKYDISIGTTTFYAWNKGEVYTTSMKEGEFVSVVSKPEEDYVFIGFGSIS